MHDANLKHRVFGSMAAAGFFLLCFMSYIVGRSNVDTVLERGSQMRQTVGLMKKRLHLCKSDLLELHAHKDIAISEGSQVKQIDLANQLLERENALLMNIYNDLLSNTADCEADLKRAHEMRGVEDQSLENVLVRLGYENKQLEETKDTIKQEKKDLGKLKKKYITAMRLENKELRAEYMAKQEADGKENSRREMDVQVKKRKRQLDFDEENAKEKEDEEHVQKKRKRRHEEEEDDAPPPPRKKKCIDFSDECPQWADDGECTTNKSYMAKHCKRSCGLCRAAKSRVRDIDE